ncbi:hypothetical protein ACFVGN_01230 [Streptomyces sp. NPDC057757]|uniref:hypothetical protein n=1 Tax=Streptomyces sp. NPDC057757 TaxID=3346241 RepID=UPI0036A2F365
MTEPLVELEHEFSLDIEYDPSRWLELPPRWDAEEWQDIDAWTRSCAGLFWRSCGQDPGESGIPFLAGVLRRFAEAFAPEPFDTRVLLRMWEPTSMPLQVFSMVKPAQGDREEALRFLVGAEDPDAVEPPVVESFHTERLGRGLRTFRYLRPHKEVIAIPAPIEPARPRRCRWEKPTKIFSPTSSQQPPKARKGSDPQWGSDP